MDTVTPLAGQPSTDTAQPGTELGDACGCECALPFLTGIDVARATADAPREPAGPQAALDAALP